MAKSWLVSGFLVALLGSALTTNPAVKIKLFQSGLDYAKSIGLVVMNKRVPGVTIPDVSGSESILHYKLSSLRITRFNAPSNAASASLHPPNNVELKVGSVTAGLSANYEISVGSGWLKITKHGSITASLGSSSVDQMVGVTQSNGRPQLTTGHCQSNLGGLDITFHGDLIDDIINLFKSVISDYIKGKIAPIICQELATVINSDANKELAGIPISVDVTDGFYIDYGLTGNPVVEGSDVSIGMLGVIWYQGHQHDPNIPKAGPMGPPQGVGSKMLCVEVNAPAVAGSGSYALMTSGRMYYNLDTSVLKQFGLSSTILDCNCGTGQCVGTFIPQIQQKCNGTGSVVSMKLQETDMPTLYVNTTAGYATLSGDLIVTGHENGVSTELFVAHCTVSAAIPSTLQFSGWKITGEIHVTGATLSIKRSDVGTIDGAGLQQLWQLALITVVEGKLDDLTKQGIQLPQIPYVTVKSPHLQFGDQTLTVCGDIQYNGPTMDYYQVQA